MSRSASWLYLCLMLMLAGITWWLNMTVHKAGPSLGGMHRHDVDYDAENFSTTLYDLNGKPAQILAAARMMHYPDDDSTQLVKPVYTRQDAGTEKTITIHSDRGRTVKGGDDVWFMDHVDVLYLQPNNSPAHVYTSLLHVLTHQNKVIIPAPVEIINADMDVHASGLEMDTRTRQVQLKGRVHVIYLHPHRGDG